MNEKAPVLLITFNRPDTTIKVLEKIKEAKVSKLYIFNDAPRKGNENDQKARSEIKEMLNIIDWDCELNIWFSDINLGCGPGPSSAITWAFENEDRLVILEDDCVPAIPFFNYCNELLERYKNDTRIWIVSGNNYSEEKKVSDSDYFFSTYGHSWGWATWKRCWENFDLEVKQFPKYFKEKRFYDAFGSKKEANFFAKIQKKIFEDKTIFGHVWDFQAGFMVRANGGLCINPSKNLVTNIGFVGTHSSTKNKFHNRPVDKNYRITKHPEFILVSKEYDEYHFRTHWKKMKPSLLDRVCIKIRKIVKI